MAKHNDKEFHEELMMSFKQKLEEQFRRGLAQGMFAACKVMLDKASDEQKTTEELVEDIKVFCSQIVKMGTDDSSASTKAVE